MAVRRKIEEPRTYRRHSVVIGFPDTHHTDSQYSIDRTTFGDILFVLGTLKCCMLCFEMDQNTEV